MATPTPGKVLESKNITNIRWIGFTGEDMQIEKLCNNTE